MANCANHTQTPAVAYCRTCGKPLCDECKRDVRGVIYCEECIAARLQGTLPPAANPPTTGAVPPGAMPAATVAGAPNPVLATLLGFIPGVGAMYNGQFAKGFAHIVVFAVLIQLLDRAEGPFFALMLAGWVFYMVFDAFKTAKAKQLGQAPPDLFGLASIAGEQSSDFRSRVRGVNAQVDDFGRRQNKPPIGAIILIGLGAMFLLDNIGLVSFHRIDEYVLPLALIGIGVWLGLRRWNEADEYAKQQEGNQP
jgi:TM2 domain-containing membrane protein YozV